MNESVEVEELEVERFQLRRLGFIRLPGDFGMEGPASRQAHSLLAISNNFGLVFACSPEGMANPIDHKLILPTIILKLIIQIIDFTLYSRQSQMCAFERFLRLAIRCDPER